MPDVAQTQHDVQSEKETCWREVEARVHISLSPMELATNAYAAASKLAFQSLLMRYNPQLGGVAVAHKGGLRLAKQARFVGASPYGHLTATATLLVFSPPKGMDMVGVVTHVGPDHVAMSVLQAFHAVLPLEPLREFYKYDYRVGIHGLVKKWMALGNAEGFEEEVTLGRQIRFVVDGVKAARNGLFQILASLDPALERKGLGVIKKKDEVVIVTKGGLEETGESGAFRGGGEEEDVTEMDGGVDIMAMGTVPIGRRSSIARSSLGGGRFGDVLGTGRRKSVTFQDMEAKDEPKSEPREVLMDVESASPVLTQTEEKKEETKEERRERKRKKKEEKTRKEEAKRKKEEKRREKEKRKEKRKSGEHKKQRKTKEEKQEEKVDYIKSEDEKEEAPRIEANGQANGDVLGMKVKKEEKEERIDKEENVLEKEKRNKKRKRDKEEVTDEKRKKKKKKKDKEKRRKSSGVAEDE